MRYFIIMLLSAGFCIASIFALFYIVEFLSNPRSLYVMDSYLSLPSSVGILVATATIYPTLCGLILSGGKLFDAASECFAKYIENKKNKDK